MMLPILTRDRAAVSRGSSGGPASREVAPTLAQLSSTECMQLLAAVSQTAARLRARRGNDGCNGLYERV
jgi:hypothetical protein